MLLRISSSRVFRAQGNFLDLAQIAHSVAILTACYAGVAMSLLGLIKIAFLADRIEATVNRPIPDAFRQSRPQRPFECEWAQEWPESVPYK